LRALVGLSSPLGPLARLLLLVFLGLAAGCGGSAPDVDPSSQRSLRQGPVVGTASEDGHVHAWRGLPYAAPPVGPLRWRAPEPAPGWEGLRAATESGNRCVQLGGDPVQGSEDCLYLDVHAPAVAVDAVPEDRERWPVMFWIHGGGNSMGWGDQTPARGPRARPRGRRRHDQLPPRPLRLALASRAPGGGEGLPRSVGGISGPST
jgi:hypothetical protein